ncbi:MAG: hypothetical protein ACYC7E_07285 [Armatimonadota bacterium]
MTANIGTSESATVTQTPLRAIRRKCLDCTCGQVKEVRECPATTCPLFRFRLGKGNRALAAASDGLR